MAATLPGALPGTELHHRTPRCLLRLRDRADLADGLTAEGLAAWVEYEHEALRFGVDPDVGREELAALVAASAEEIPAAEHRELHAGDFVRWGSRGGRRTLELYGRGWFRLLGRRRWRGEAGATAEDLARHLAGAGR